MPNTVNKILNIPNTGDLVGTWGSAAINPDMVAIDGMFGGVATVSLSNVNVNLTAPVGAVTPSAGPTQQQNAVIRLTGTLTAHVFVTLTLPGYYIFHNQCSGIVSFAAFVTNAAFTGSRLGLAPGKAQHIYCDGVNSYYINTPEVGSYVDLAVATVPAWVSLTTPASFVSWLVCDGSVYNISSYPTLGAILGATFGGNGSTTFGVPDHRGRSRYMVDQGTGRLTSATMSTNGTIAGAGGTQTVTLVAGNIPLLTTGVENQPHTHTLASQVSGGNTGQAGGDQLNQFGNVGTTSGPSLQHTHQVGNASPSAINNMPPAIITGLVLIKT